MKSAEQRAIEALYPDAYKLAEDQSGALQSTMNLSPLFWDMSNQVEPGPLKFDLPPTTGIPSQDNPESFQQYEYLLGRQATEAERDAYNKSLVEDPRSYGKLLDDAMGVARKQSRENIYQQLKGQSENLGTAKTFQTGAAGGKEGGLGSTDAVMRDMAEKLAVSGLTSIEHLGQRQTPDGGQEYYNKATGDSLKLLSGYDGRGWSGTSAGDGQTIYNVQFDPATGLPIFYNQQKHGKDDYADLIKIAAIGTAIFAPQIGAAILGAGAPAAAALAVGSAVSGFIGSGGDIKEGIKAGLASYLGGQAGSWASGATNSALVGNIAGNMTRAAILGGNMEQALVSSLVQAAPAEISKYIPNFKDLPRAVQETAVAATVDMMRSGGDNLGQIALQGAAKGATDYAVSQIDGYKDLRPAQQEIIRSRLSNVLGGESLSNELLQGAIQMGSESVQNEVNNEKAQKAGWSDYATQQAAKSLYGDKVTPDLYADKQETTEAEAKAIARDILGREPTEFEYMQLIGLPEREAAQNSDLQAVRYDESTFDSNELAEAYKGLYGKEPTDEWLAENMDLLGRSDAQGKNMLESAYTKDKNWVTEGEAEQFWKDMGNTGPVPQEFMDNMLMTTEAGAKAMSETYRIVRDDINATTFDGSKFKDQASAQTAAIKDGYNAYNWDNKTYYLMSQDQATQLQKDIADGKTGGARPDAFFTLAPGASLAEQLAAAGNPEEYAYQQGDVITVVGKRMETPEYEDLEAWKAFKDEKQAAGGDNFQSFLTEQFSILEQALKGAPEDSIGKVMADAAMFGYGKMAQLVQAFSGAGESAGIPQAERAKNIAKQVESWSNKLVSQGIQNAEAAVLANVAVVTKESIAAERGVKPSDISTAELYAKKTAALFKQIPNNPLGVSLFLAGEGIQEIPLLAVSGGVGNVLKSVATRGIQMAGATGTNVFLNGTESFGGNYNEVKEYLRKQGVPESQIEALAVKSGFEAMAVGMMTAYAGDRALIKSFMGDLAKDSFGKVVATNSAREWFMGNLEGSLQNMSAQIGKYGSIKSEDEWLNAGIMEGFAQKGIAAGVLTAASLDKAVAKDYDGKPVTYKEVIEGTKTFDPKTLDTAFSFGNGVNLGDAIGYHSTFITNPDITPDEYFYAAQTFRDNGMNDFTPQEIASIVGTPGEMSPEQISEIAQPYAQDRVVTPQEAQQMMRDLGYTNFTDAEAMSLAGQISEADARAKVEEYVAPRQVTREEAADFFASIPGYAPTKEDIDAFVRQGADINQENVRAELEQYIDPRLVSEQEVRDAYADLGLSEPTQADIDKLVGQYAQDSLAGRAQENLGTAQFNVTTANQEATQKAIADLEAQTKAQYDALSTAQKAEADARLAQGQTLQEAIAAAQATTAGQISDLEAQTTEQYNTLTAAQKATADALVAQGTTLADAIEAAKTETAGQITDVETRLTDAIAAAEAMGLSRDQAITAAVESVAAELGTTKDALLTQLGTTEETLRSEFATGLAGVSAEVKAAYDSLSAEQKALADQLTQQGTDLATAIQTVQQETAGQIGALSADVQAKYDALTAEQKALADAMAQQGLDLTAAIDLAAQQTQAQITGLGQQVDTRINELMQQGQTYQQATQQAIGELNQQNQQLQGLVGTQGRQATQADIDALSQMLGGQRSMDLTYDVTGDKQITQADIDFLTQVVGGVNTDWRAPVGSAFGPTGLYGQLASNEAQRKADLQAQLAREEAARQAEAERQKLAAAEAQRQEKISAVRGTLAQTQQGIQGAAQQLPQAFQQAQQVSTPLYGTMEYFDPFGDPFAQQKMRMASSTNPADQTKMAAGGYIDDLLAGEMTVDDLLNLLR